MVFLYKRSSSSYTILLQYQYPADAPPPRLQIAATLYLTDQSSTDSRGKFTTAQVAGRIPAVFLDIRGKQVDSKAARIAFPIAPDANKQTTTR